MNANTLSQLTTRSKDGIKNLSFSKNGGQSSPMKRRFWSAAVGTINMVMIT